MSVIRRPATAFAVSASPRKRPRAESKDHLAWIRTLPCLVTGRRPVDAAHIRYGDLARGKRETGMGEKPSDIFCVPLHHAIHMQQHEIGERVWWQQQGIDPVVVALSLWGCTGDDFTAEIILACAREARP